MEWNEVRILEFLEVYQQEELIWNPKHRNHNNKQKINDAWNRVSASMRLPVSKLKLKKNSLMACFRAHLRKKKSSIRSGMGAEDVYQPIWFAFKFMEDFLAPVYVCGSDCGDTIDTEDNVSSPANEEQHVNEQQSFSEQTGNTENQNIEIIHYSEEMDHDSRVHTQSSRDTSSDFPAPTSQRQRCRQLASEISDAQKKIEQTFETLNNVISEKKRDVEDDDCDLYGKLLANKLRNYSKYERHHMMHEIDGLLLRKPPSIISNISCNSYSTSSPGQYSTDSLLQSPVHMNIPNQPFSAASYVDLPSQSLIHRSSSSASSYTPMPSQSPVQINIPNRPSSAATSYAPFQSQSPIHRPSSATSSYTPMPSQSPVQISIPNRLSSAATSYAPFQSQIRRPSSAASSYTSMPSQSPVQISIPNRPSSAATSYAPFQSQSPDQRSISNYQLMPSSVSTTQSNQIHILSVEVILPSINILQHALTNAEIDESDLL